MKNVVASRDDHEATLAWLDDSLEWARPGDRVRLVELLNLVRTEILFDMYYSRNAPPFPKSGTVNESAFDANRGT